MAAPARWVVVGLDNGGTMNNATVLDSEGRFLVDRMAESPSYVREGPEKAIEALARSLDEVLERTGVPRAQVRAVGLDTPGPVSADGVIALQGATNFGDPAWCGFDVRGADHLRSSGGLIFLWRFDEPFRMIGVGFRTPNRRCRDCRRKLHLRCARCQLT